MSRQALGLQGERRKNGRNASFFPLPNFEVFNESELLETSNDLEEQKVNNDERNPLLK